MLLSFIAPVLLAFSLGDSPPLLELPAEVPGQVGQFVVVTARTDQANVRWYSPDGLSLIPPALLKDSRSAIVLSAQPGRFRLVAYTASGDVPTDPAVCWVVVNGATPQPTPTPTPQPQPQPEPTPTPEAKGQLEVVVIEESGAPFPGRGTYFEDKALKDALVKGKHHMTIVDQNIKGADGKPPKELVPYLTLAAGKALPYCVVVNKNSGKIYYKGSLPTTPADMTNLVHKYGG